MTKLDGDARGGAALSVRAVTGKPIKFIGTGEKLDAIEPFYPDRMASRILGMGDVMTLVEKAQAAVDEKKAAEMEKKLRAGRMDLNDFLDQMQQMKNMGGMQEMLSMMPGLSGKQLSSLQVDEHAMSRTEAIVLSMTPKERSAPDIISYSRKKRIAAGCGLKIEDVNRLLKQFDQMQTLIKQFSGPAGKKLAKKGRLPFSL